MSALPVDFPTTTAVADVNPVKIAVGRVNPPGVQSTARPEGAPEIPVFDTGAVPVSPASGLAATLSTQSVAAMFALFATVMSAACHHATSPLIWSGDGAGANASSRARTVE